MSATLVLSPVDVFAARSRNARVWARCSAALQAGRLADALAHVTPDARLCLGEPVAGLPASVGGTAGLVATWKGFAGFVRCVSTVERRFEHTADPDVALVEQRLEVELRDGTRRTVHLRSRVRFDEDRIAEVHDERGSDLRLLVEIVRAAARR